MPLKKRDKMLLTPIMTLLAVQCPQIPFHKMCDIIHAPELWATGAGIMLGVPPFKIEHVTGPFSLQKECMVAFNVGAQKVCLLGKAPDRATLTIFNPDSDLAHTEVVCNIHAICNNGSNMVLDIKTKYEIEPSQYRMALQAGIQSLPDISKIYQHPVLKKYRDNLKNFPKSNL